MIFFEAITAALYFIVSIKERKRIYLTTSVPYKKRISEEIRRNDTIFNTKRT